MFYVVNNHLNNLYVLSNKAIEPGENPKLINVGPTSIPETRVTRHYAYTYAKQCIPVILIFTYRSLTAALAVLMNVMIRYRKEPAGPCSPSTKK